MKQYNILFLCTHNSARSVLGEALASTNQSGLFVKPIRQVVNGSLPSGFYNMAYNPTTGEIIYWT